MHHAEELDRLGLLLRIFIEGLLVSFAILPSHAKKATYLQQNQP